MHHSTYENIGVLRNRGFGASSSNILHPPPAPAVEFLPLSVKSAKNIIPRSISM